ncbi:MAG: GNAT family N-acetyltransferase [Gemmatimonadetes bacterium]|nr:GNAT family N-acetyltransferase [Gemmatimonadota bacterium]
MPSPSRKYRAFPGITFRVMDQFQDFGQCVELQRETWGRDWTDVMPPSILKVSQKVGGILAGAFDKDGKLLGFVFGLTGLMDRKPAHWSHQLAVTHAYRNSGLGRQLKLYQRDLLLSRGISVMYWTYDPLVARNAHLNLNRLGARIHEYVPDFYKGETSSEMHSGVGTDRFIVRWPLKDARTRRGLAGKAVTDYSKYADSPVIGLGGWAARRLGDRIRIRIPADILELQRTDIKLAWEWRKATRAAFVHYLKRGWQVNGIYRDTDGQSSFYVMLKGRK